MSQKNKRHGPPWPQPRTRVHCDTRGVDWSAGRTQPPRPRDSSLGRSLSTGWRGKCPAVPGTRSPATVPLRGPCRVQPCWEGVGCANVCMRELCPCETPVSPQLIYGSVCIGKGCSWGSQRLRGPGQRLGGGRGRGLARPGLHLNWAVSRHSSTLGRCERWYRRVCATFRGTSLSLMACFSSAMLCSWSAISRSVCTQDSPHGSQARQAASRGPASSLSPGAASEQPVHWLRRRGGGGGGRGAPTRAPGGGGASVERQQSWWSTTRETWKDKSHPNSLGSEPCQAQSPSSHLLSRSHLAVPPG